MKYKMNERLVRYLVLLVFVSLMSDGTLAAKRTFITFGAKTCANWLKHESEKGSDKDSMGIAWLADRSWLAGYMTGINQMTTGSRDLLAGLDLETITDWTDQFCQKNTEADVTDAIAALFKKLKWQP